MAAYSGKKKGIKPLQISDKFFHVGNRQAAFDFNGQHMALIHDQ